MLLSRSSLFRFHCHVQWRLPSAVWLAVWYCTVWYCTLALGPVGIVLGEDDCAPAEPLGLEFQVTAAEGADMPPEEALWPGGPGEAVDLGADDQREDRGGEKLNRWVTRIAAPTLAIYRPEEGASQQAAVIICPGGGYGGLALDKEGHDVARWLRTLGVTGVVLKYRVVDYGHPAPLEDAQQAIAVVRHRARQLGLKPDRIGIMGFSAGGHVAASASTHWRAVEIDGEMVSARPDFSILVYPVISMDPEITHLGSRRNLLGKFLTSDGQMDELVDYYCLERHVTPQTPPAFLVHALDDRAVPIENSLRYYRALQKQGVDAELAIYESGGHGFGLGLAPGPLCDWPRRCQQWLAARDYARDTEQAATTEPQLEPVGN